METTKTAPRKMTFKIEIRCGHKPGFENWVYQGKSSTLENAEKAARTARTWFGGKCEARVVAL